MAGYHGYSKSNNAIEAERSGKMTATALAKWIGGGATAAGVATVLSPCEWHHTSKMYNATDYYDFDGAAETLAREKDPEEDCNDYEIQFAADSLKETIRLESKRLKAEGKQTEVLTGQTVRWIVWGGSIRRPKAFPQVATGCTVTITGCWADIETPDGQNFRKKIGANGFSFGPDEPAKEQGNA